MVKNNSEIDWKYVKEKLKELEMWSFAEKVFALIKQWFQIDMPFMVSDLNAEFYEEATEQILNNGVFGFQNNENKGNRIAQGKGNGKIYLPQMIRRSLKTIFLKYDYMILMPRYSYLEKRPYLLPAAWIHRGIVTFKNNGLKRVVGMLKSPFVRKELVEKRKKYFERWK